MKLLANGWCAEYDVKLKGMPDDELKDLFKDIFKYQVLNFRQQDLTPNDFLRIAESAGIVQKRDPKDGDRGADLWEIDGILRVGGNAITGKDSLFHHKHDLDWHANQPSNLNRKRLIWLYAAQGTAGSRNSWLNNVDSYNDLPQDIKDKIEDAYVYCGYESGRYSTSPFFKDHVKKDNPVKLVQTFGDHKGLFFPFYQIFEVAGWTENESKDLIEYLQNHILQEKYMWHLDWQDGDINVAEQILTIHKRWAFEAMDRRILWRIASGHENL